jgi:hypothetical protein
MDSDKIQWGQISLKFEIFEFRRLEEIVAVRLRRTSGADPWTPGEDPK